LRAHYLEPPVVVVVGGGCRDCSLKQGINFSVGKQEWLSGSLLMRGSQGLLNPGLLAAFWGKARYRQFYNSV
jgi:hypothetical protein